MLAGEITQSYNQSRHKSLANIEQFITHYYDYYIKILTFFHDMQDKVIVVDVSKGIGIERLRELLNTDNPLPHANKTKAPEKLAAIVYSFIDKVIANNKDKQDQLDQLLVRFKTQQKHN